jgi:tetratricopeptide (TPR) repeat protein
LTRSAKADALIGGRYRVQRVLGIGGMACVYLTIDSVTGRELAVKRLTVRTRDRAYEEAAALFVREFHTLIALSQPCVVEVYDYGVDELGPFYTMEHVEGGDLKERAPCDWRSACSLAYDVCSVLALLHSRRLVHGDISPRNVRYTRDGRAKLIDFGALSSMGPCDKIIGTPAFVAPEVVSRLTSDARTDLYSLGGSLYYALTGQLPYPVSDFAGLAQAWQTPPLPPSRMSPESEIPAALDALVLSLLAQDPVERPSNSYEVMARLSALAGLSHPDELELAQAHLSTPALQGRDEALASMRVELARMLDGDGGGVLIVGAPGEGRSRLLDEAVALAKTTGAVVLRIGGVRGTRGAAFSIVEQLLESFPERAPKLFSVWPVLAPLSAAALAHDTWANSVDELRASRPALVTALTDVMFAIAAEQPLMVAADDVQRLDHASLSLLVALVTGTGVPRQKRLSVLTTAEGARERSAQHEGPALALLAAECRVLALAPLNADHTQQLLGSMFGDVPNLSLLSARVFERARGNPRATFDLLQYLIAERRIVYARGGWTLPSALSDSDLPLTEAAAVQARVASLPRFAREILWAHALAPRAAFRREDYAAFLGVALGPGQRLLDHVIAELLRERWLRYDGLCFSAAHPSVANLVLAAADGGSADKGDTEALKRVHRGLAGHYRQRGNAVLLIAKHLFAAGESTSALSEVLRFLAEVETSEQLVAAAKDRPSDAAEVLAQALDVARESARPAREVLCLEQWLMMLSPVVDSAYYAKVGPALRAKLAHDSGQLAYRAALASAPKEEALAQALMQASAAYARASAAEQGLPPEQAIEWLARYVAVSIAIGSKTHDGALLASLPELLEPFTGLSPLLEALWQNALAVCESSLHCQYLQACARWRGVIERLPNSNSKDLQYVQYIRRAIVFALGLLEVRLGFAMGGDWTEQLDADPTQAVNAMYLRKCLRLQAGDREGAEDFRKQAELLHLRSAGEQMFASNLMLELSAHALARDVQGVKQLWDRIIPQAARYPGWVAVELMARGLFHQLVGEPEQAREAYEACLREADLERDAGTKVVLTWPTASAGYVETLSELGLFAEARAQGERILGICQAREIGVASHATVRALALAEAKSGETERARARLGELLDEQRALGVKGILLAATYEARAKVALCMQDDASYREYARLGAAEYCEAHTSSLSTRYSGWITDTRERPSHPPQAPDDECFDTVQLRGSNGPRTRTRGR